MNYLIRKTFYGMYWAEVFNESGLVYYISKNYHTPDIAENGARQFITALGHSIANLKKRDFTTLIGIATIL